MRVESKPTVVSGMGKRKLKLRTQQKHANEFPDSSDENLPPEARSICPHISKGVNLNLVKKAIKTLGLTGECMNCKNPEKSTNFESTEASESPEDSSEYTVWLCLQCGNQGCDRNSKHRHSLKHFETPRSTSHHLVLNLTTCVVWCYGCDDEVPSDIAKKLSECVEFVKKQIGVAPSLTQPGKRSIQQKPPEREESPQPVTVEKEEKLQGNNIKPVPSQTQQIVLPKVKGLSNLGNTCFFNAVMQNLSQTPVLASILSEHGQMGACVQLPGKQLQGDMSGDNIGHLSGEEDTKLELSPMTIRLEQGGALTNSLVSFLKDMSNFAGKSSVVTPSSLFGQVCKKAPRFKGFQQQDSHELLRYLLDGMKAEEIRRCQMGILKAFNVPNNKNLDEDTKAKVKEYGAQVKHTFVDSVFGGVFISTVHCEECNIPSQILEPFLDISLPVTEEKTIRPGNLSRKLSKGADVPPDDADMPVYNKTSGPSKHMKKKERKELKKKKGRKQGKKGIPDKSPVQGEESKDEQKPDTEAVKEEEEGEEEEGEEQEEGDEGNEEAESMEVTNNGEVDKNSCSKEVLQGVSVVNSAQALGEGQDEDSSDADVEDNDDGCRSSAVEVGSCEHINQLSPGEFSSGLRGGSSDAVITDSSPSNLPHNEPQTDTKEDKVDDEKGTENSKLTQGSNCDSNVQENHLASSELTEETLMDVECKDCDTTDNNREKMKTSTPVNGIVKEITESLDNLTVSETKPKELQNIDKSQPKSEDEKEEIEAQNLSNINKQVLSNSSPNISSLSPKLSRSSSRSSTNSKSKNQLKIEARIEAMRSLTQSRYQPDSHECSVQSCLNQFTAAELLTGSNKFGCENCSKRAKGYKDGKPQMVYTNASKQLLIFSPPAVLTLHMKRFQQVGFSLRKVNRHVDFPLVLDIAPYCSSLSQGVAPDQQEVLYSLYGIVEHSGRLSGGHYTAFVKVRPNSSSQVKAFLQQNNLHIHHLDQLLLMKKETMDKGEGGAAVGGPEEEVNGGTASSGKWYYISDSRVTETTERKVLSCQAYLLFYERIRSYFPSL